MAELKTKPTRASVAQFLNAVEDETKRKDCKEIAKMMKAITGKTPKLWGDSIVGYGTYHYKYPTGNEGDWFITGVAPRKQAITVYIMAGFDRFGELMGKLGKYKTGKSCLYIKKLNDIDRDVLYQLIDESVKYIRKKYECK